MKLRVVEALSCAGLLALSSCGAPANGALEPPPEGGEVVEPIKASPPYYGDPAHDAVFGVDISHWEGPMAQAEMDCFWDSGVRHVVSGTQVEEVTRQQLAMAVSRGMTVDAYVYLYWTDDIAGQVKEAFERTAGFPIGRMWLDVEQDPGGLGATELAIRVKAAADACLAEAGAECGIYTGRGFWTGEMADTTQFATLPLWYAHYNFKKELSHWSTESFGGWTEPVAKQWAEEVLCSVGVDKDTMQVVTEPTLVDRSLPPAPTQPPPAPTGLYPADGARVSLDYVKLMTGLVPHATQYQLALESWDGAAFKPYYTWTRVDGFQKVTPQFKNRFYRFRARAQNVHGWGAWSGYSVFEFGKSTTAPPSGTPEQPPPPPPPTGGGDFGTLSPNGTTHSSPSVTLSCAAVTNASSYEFTIETSKSDSWMPYVKYTTTGPSRTFYPQLHQTTYRWRVRALVNGAWSAPSYDATFQYQ
ncbi:MAG: hypothetical protein IPM35_08405 [Myxococcales bacterium]|nr:hypothetical protein [Myxococcales bacterium]